MDVVIKNPSPVTLSVTDAMGSWLCTISERVGCMATLLWNFTNMSLNNASVLLANTFIIVINSICIGPYIGSFLC